MANLGGEDMKEGAAYRAASAGQQTGESTVSSSSPAGFDPVVERDKSRPSNAPGRADASEGRGKSKVPAAARGLSFARFFTEAGLDPFDEIEWEFRSAVIGNER